MADKPPQAYAMAEPGEGVLDLALADLDADGRNDLLALTTDGKLAVRRGVEPNLDKQFLGPLALYDTGVTKLGRMAVGATECPATPDLPGSVDALDVVMTAPGDRGIVILRQSGPASFGAPVFAGTVATEGKQAGAPQDVAIGNLDGEGAPDLAVINDNGTVNFSFAGDCGGGISAVHARDVWKDLNASTPDALILTDDVFCGTALADMTVAFGDRLATYCNDGHILEASFGAFEGTHRWDINGQDGIPMSLSLIGDAVWWPSPGALYILSSRKILRLTDPGAFALDDAEKMQVLRITAKSLPNEFALLRHIADGQADWWRRIAWVGKDDAGSGVGFAR